MPIQWTTDSKGNRTATWVDDEPAAPKAQAKPSVSAPGSGLLDVITKDAPVLLEGSAKGLTKGIETLQKTGDVGRALGAAGRAYVDTVAQSNNPIPRVVLGGARDLVQNTLGNMPADVGSLLTNKPRLQNAPDAPILGVIPPLPKVKLQGPGEELASNIVQFALGWVPVAKGLNLAGQLATKAPGIVQGVQAARTAGAFLKGNKVAGAVLKGGEIATKGALTGSVVDFAVMDVDGGRLTDVVVQLNPTIRKFTEQTIGTPLELPYIEYLRSKPGDKAAEARWKNAIEGNFFVGPPIEAVMWATGRFARASSQYLQTIGQPKARPVVDVTAEAVPAAPVPKASKAEVAAAEVELRQAATDLEEATAKLATPEPPAPVAAAAPQEIPVVPIGQVVDEAVPPAPRATPLADALEANLRAVAQTDANVYRRIGQSIDTQRQGLSQLEDPALPPAAAAPEFTAKLEAAEAKVTGLRQQLEELGPEPRKPSSEKRMFGAKGKEGADPEAVARWEADTKAYNGWRRKYLKLKKDEVAASNEAFGLRQQADEMAAAPAAAAPEPSVPSAGTSATKAEPPDTRGKGEFYHGTAKEIDRLDEGYYENANIYGQGFYVTDDLKTAGSYTKKYTDARTAGMMKEASAKMKGMSRLKVR